MLNVVVLMDDASTELSTDTLPNRNGSACAEVAINPTAATAPAKAVLQVPILKVLMMSPLKEIS